MMWNDRRIWFSTPERSRSRVSAGVGWERERENSQFAMNLDQTPANTTKKRRQKHVLVSVSILQSQYAVQSGCWRTMQANGNFESLTPPTHDTYLRRLSTRGFRLSITNPSSQRLTMAAATVTATAKYKIFISIDAIEFIISFSFLCSVLCADTSEFSEFSFSLPCRIRHRFQFAVPFLLWRCGKQLPLHGMFRCGIDNDFSLCFHVILAQENGSLRNGLADGSVCVLFLFFVSLASASRPFHDYFIYQSAIYRTNTMCVDCVVDSTLMMMVVVTIIYHH